MARRYVHAGGLGAPLMRYEGGNTSDRNWYFTDERGSVIAEADDTGASLYTNTYDEYGVEGSGNSGAFGYAGQMRLAGTGLTHNRNRVYNASLGRFMSTDPIGQSGGLNLYGYVGGDPVNFVDPWGLVQELPGCDEAPDQSNCREPGTTATAIRICPTDRTCLTGEDALQYLFEVFRDAYERGDCSGLDDAFEGMRIDGGPNSQGVESAGTVPGTPIAIVVGVGTIGTSGRTQYYMDVFGGIGAIGGFGPEGGSAATGGTSTSSYSGLSFGADVGPLEGFWNPMQFFNTLNESVNPIVHTPDSEYGRSVVGSGSLDFTSFREFSRSIRSIGVSVGAKYTYVTECR